jgi:hypothetical protein
VAHVGMATSIVSANHKAHTHGGWTLLGGVNPQVLETCVAWSAATLAVGPAV